MDKIKELETTKINDVDYVKKADVEKIFTGMEREGFTAKYLLPDRCHVMALASCTMTEDYKLVMININLLKKAITIFKQIDMDYVTCGFKEDFPLIMGKLNEEKTIISGVVIAPRIEHDDDV